MSVDTLTDKAEAPHATRTLAIDFLFLDLTTCTRCRGTDRSLDAALNQVADVLRSAGIAVEVTKTQVVSADQARALRFVSSPTIRVDGADIAVQLRESSCGAESCTDGCGDHIACRVWEHEGTEYTEPPATLIVDAILRRVYGIKPPPGSQPYVLPENLRRFFDGRVGTATAAPTIASAAESPLITDADRNTCCSPAAQQDCCEPTDKNACCDSNGPGCGCR